MSPNTHPGDPSRTDSENSQDAGRPAGAASSPASAGAPNLTRRRLVRSVGAGAVLLGGGTAAPGVTAGQSDTADNAVIVGIESWELTTEEIDADAVQDGPSVAFEDDEIVITGSESFTAECQTFVVRGLHITTETSRLNVVVETAPIEDPDDPVCLPLGGALRYELTVTTEAFAEAVFIQEAFTDDDPSYHSRDGDAGIDLPAEVADYEFTVGPEVGPDDAAVLTPSEADATKPSVTFDGDDVVVEGAIAYGSSSCDEVALDAVQRRYGVEGHVEVRLGAQRQAGVEPDDPCYSELEATYYRLELTGSGEPPIERCSVHEDSPDVHHSLTVEERDADLEYPEGVADHRLVLDRSGDADDLDAEPTVSYVVGDEPAVVVEGTMDSGSSSCSTIDVGELAVDEEHTSILNARLDRTERENDLEICTDDGVVVDYRLELTVEQFPDAVAAAEGVDGVEDPERRVIVDFHGGASELPEGVLEYTLSTEGGADAEDVHADPDISADASAAPSVVTVDGALTVSACDTTAVTDVRWEDDAQSHLSVTVTAVDEQGQPATPSDCPLEALPEQIDYTAELRLESLPDVVTAEEHVVDGEPERSATVELDGTGGCGAGSWSTTVDGQTVCDVNDDGYYRDVTGDGSVGQGDVGEFFSKQHRDAWKQPELFDFSGNGAVTHGDVVELADYVALR